jgi:hypothetical protein
MPQAGINPCYLPISLSCRQESTNTPRPGQAQATVAPAVPETHIHAPRHNRSALAYSDSLDVI